MRVLFLSRWLPYPPNNGSKLRIYNLLKGLSHQHKVTLVSFYESPNDLLNLSDLHSFCDEVHVIPWKKFQPDSRRARLGFVSSRPRSFVDTFSAELVQKIDRALSDRDYDLIIASQIDMAAYASYFHGLPAIFEEVEVGVLYERYSNAKSIWERVRYGLTWLKYRRFLTSLLRNYRLCTVVSDHELRLLHRAVSNNTSVKIVPNCVDLASYQDVHEQPRPNTVIFAGAFTYPPNYEAMNWFLAEVYGRIIEHIPNVRLMITGDHSDLPLPSTRNVELTGFVDDVRPLIARSWCSLAPLQTGGGTRLKILESMALGTPVIATSKGAQGLDVRHGEHLLIADEPRDFAQAVIRLLQDRALRQQLVRNAYELIHREYEWSVVLPGFLNMIDQILNVNP